MTKNEIELIGKVVLACRCTLSMQAGLLPSLKDESFRQMEDLEKALELVRKENDK